MKPKKKLYLSDNKMIAGVMAGFAEYFDQDPTIWRLGAVVFLVLTGFMPGVLLYMLAWIVMPHRNSTGVHEAEYTVVDDNEGKN